jgi:hypothetical protein
MFASRLAKPQTKMAATSSNGLAHDRSTPLAHRLGDDTANEMLLLQRTLGNQAVLRVLMQRASRVTANGPGKHQGAAINRDAPPSAPLMPPIMEPKLIVGEVDDPLEHEADRVADQVMRMSAVSATTIGSVATVSEAALQRKCQQCDADDKLRRQAAPNAATQMAHVVQQRGRANALQRQEAQPEEGPQADSTQQDGVHNESPGSADAQTESTTPGGDYPDLSGFLARIDELKAAVAYVTRDQNIPQPAAHTETGGVTWCPLEDNADLGKPKSQINRAGVPGCLVPCVAVHEQTHTEFMAMPCEELGLAFGRVYFWLHVAKQYDKDNQPTEVERAAKQLDAAINEANKTFQWYSNYMNKTCRYDEATAYEAGIRACDTDDARKRCASAGQTADYETQMAAWKGFMQNPPNC